MLPTSVAVPAPAPLSSPDRPVGASAYGLPPQVVGLLLVFSLVGVLTTNPLLTVAALAVFPLAIALSWRPGEPPVLAFVVAFHWLQATAKVFHANILGVDASELIMYPQLGQFADVETASWLTLAAVLVLAVGVRLAIHTQERTGEGNLLREAEAFSIPRVFWAYLALSFGLTAFYGGLGFWSGYRQIILGVVQIKWAAYFLLVYLALLRREGYLFAATAFAIEFISGIGFFSGFKEVVFVTVVTYFAARSRIEIGTVAKIAVVGVLLMVMGAAWTAVKPQYRSILSGGSGQQTTVIGQGEQVAVLYNLVANLDREDLAEGIEPLAERVAYVDFFGYALGYVPNVVPHQQGGQWGAAIKHILTPRILFPDKPALVSDSEVTNTYTGLLVAGVAEGTSISIGYVGESYVDFGPVWMFVPIFLVGLWRGLMYRFFLRKPEMRLMGFAFIVALFTLNYQVEASTGFMLGNILMRFIVLSLLFTFVAPRAVRWLQRGGAEADEAAEVPVPIRRAWA